MRLELRKLGELLVGNEVGVMLRRGFWTGRFFNGQILRHFAFRVVFDVQIRIGTGHRLWGWCRLCGRRWLRHRRRFAASLDFFWVRIGFLQGAALHFQTGTFQCCNKQIMYMLMSFNVIESVY